MASQIIINNHIGSNFIFRRFNNFVSFDRTGVQYLNCETLEMKSASDLGLRNKKNIKFRATSKNNKYILYSSIKTVINYDGGFEGEGLGGENDWRNVDSDDYFYDTEEKHYVICIFNNEAKKYLKKIELNHYPLISTDFSKDQNFLFLTFYNGPVYKVNLSGWEKLPFKLTSEITSTKTDAELDELDELRYSSLTKIKNGCINTVIFSKSTNCFITKNGIYCTDKIFEIENGKLPENIFAPYINQFKNYKIEFSHYEQDYGEEGSVVNKNILYFYLRVKTDTENTFTIQTKSPISYDNIKECYYINEHLLIRRKDDNIIKIPKILERASTFSFEDPEYTDEFSSLIDNFALISFVVFSTFDDYVAINDLPNRCIKIFSLQDNKFVGKLDYLSSDINYIIFSEDNKRIITADDEGQILVFSNEDYNLLKKVKLSLTPILFINENKDGSLTVFTQYTVIKISLND